MIETRQMTDVPGKRVWGRWPQRVQGGALVFPLYYINKKGQGVTRKRASHNALDPLGAARPDPLYLCVIINAGWYDIS